MKLQVTEVSENVFNKQKASIENVFDFTQGEVLGKLNYGTIFKAEKQPKDKSVKVSLIRQIDEKTVEIYNTATLHPTQNNATFNDSSTTNKITITFKLTK